MIETLLISILIITVCVILLSVRLLFGKKFFVNSHVEGNKALNKRGIRCVQSQDREMRTKNPYRVKERE